MGEVLQTAVPGLVEGVVAVKSQIPVIIKGHMEHAVVTVDREGDE